MNTRKQSGKLVAKLRKVIGKSQSHFAAMVGVSKHTIISVENGRNQLSQNLARRIQIVTGARISDDKFRFEPVYSHPASEEPNKLTKEALKFIRRRDDGSGRNDDAYTRDDFEQWQANFYPSNDETARRVFDQIKVWVEYIFRAAAKPIVAEKRNRLPAIHQSLVEWLNETLENFKLFKEVDEILEEETHKIGECGYDISSLKNPQDLERFKDDCAAYGYVFADVKKHFKKAKRGDWIILETESRALWDPFNNSESIPCKTRKLLPKPNIKIVDGWDFLGKFGFSKEKTLQQLRELQAKKRNSKSPPKAEPTS